MITRKHDLLDTQASGDLVVPFQELAFKLGIGWKPNGNDMVVRENYGVIVCRNFGHGLELAHRHNLKEGLKQLTLSDLKPRTKVVYEKVEFEPNEIWKAFKEHQEVGYLYVNTSDGFECLLDGVFNLAMSISQGDQLYRKVERQVEWWEDAVEYIRSLNGEANAIDFTDASSDGKKMAMNISVVLDERQAKDFARILLEQEGE